MKRFLAVFLVLVLTASIAFAGAGKGPKDKGPLEKIEIVHYEKGHAKPPWAGGGGKGKGKTKCYAFIAKDAKWKTVPSYAINPFNVFNLSESFVTSTVSKSAEVWDAASSGELFSDSYSVDYVVQAGSLDGVNAISWGQYPQDGVIAVTTIWGYFGGKPSTREIVEFDLLFDNDFEWGNADLDPLKMDLENIAVHELGHGLGLADLYESACLDETMYGYSSEGEISKRDLNSGDVQGIQKLYGA
ncbi:MAG: matrixin family metalloprotease [Candidatus Micrarchaeia archaeon]